MEAYLHRHLQPGEVVHHENGDSLDDCIENLRLYSSHSEHMHDEYVAGCLPAMHYLSRAAAAASGLNYRRNIASWRRCGRSS